MTRWEVDGFQCAIHAVAPRGGHSDCPGFPDGVQSDGCVFCYMSWAQDRDDVLATDGGVVALGPEDLPRGFSVPLTAASGTPSSASSSTLPSLA